VRFFQRLGGKPLCLNPTGAVAPNIFMRALANGGAAASQMLMTVHFQNINHPHSFQSNIFDFE